MSHRFLLRCLIACALTRVSLQFTPSHLPPSTPTPRTKKTTLSTATSDTTQSTKLSSGLPPPPRSDSNPDDDGFRSMRKNWPLFLQHFLRDSGTLRSIVDTLALFGLPDIASTYPQALPNFAILSDAPLWIRKAVGPQAAVKENTFRSIPYGHHPMQVIQLMQPISPEHGEGVGNRGTVLFVHGGAWGSGKPWMYRLVARPLIQAGFSVAVLGYRTYPDADIDGQVDDVQLASKKLQQIFPNEKITLMGHSSGAHIGLLSLLRDPEQARIIDSFVGISGVYCIPSHYEFESGRGVEEISPMKSCCNSEETTMIQNSPLQIIGDSFEKRESERWLPRVMLLHGTSDDTIPYTSTLNMGEEIANSIVEPLERERFTTKILPDVGHTDTIFQFMMGGTTRDVVLDWLMTDPEKRSNT